MFELVASLKEFSALTIITAVFLIAGAVLIASNRTIDRKARRSFLEIAIGLLCVVIADWFAYLTNGLYPELRLLHTVLLAVTFAVAPAIPVIIANTIYPERHIRIIMAVYILHAMFQIVSIAGGFVFWVDENNVYHRGVMYPVYVAAYSFSALYLVIESIRAGREYQTTNVATVIGILVCMLAGVLIQIADPTVRTTWTSVSMAVMLYFLFYTDLITRTDALTKLLNRRSYEEALLHPPLPCVAVVIDVNDFKNVNDTHGHAYGDECLTRIGHMIRQAFGSAGLCYRTGGDEFAVIMTKRLAEVDAFESELLRLVARAQEGDSRMPGLSIGHSVAQSDCTDISAVFEAADQAMYQLKGQNHH